jgi:hypothetical protein
MPAPNEHECERFAVEDFDTRGLLCLKCGIVIREPNNPEIYVLDYEARIMNSEDHYSGNGLLNSETENMDYVSRKNQGLAYKINRGGRDFEGKRVKTTLNDSYRSGCIAGGKEMILKQDPLTGETTLKFYMYDKPMLRMVKERAYSELARYGLSTVDSTIVAKHCKIIVSKLFFSELLEFAWMAAVLNAGVLKQKDAAVIEKEMYALMHPIRLKLLSRCDKALAKQLLELQESQNNLNTGIKP